MALFPLARDLVVPAQFGEPSWVLFQDGTRVMFRNRTAPSRLNGLTGVCYGIEAGPRPAAQGVAWDDGRFFPVGAQVLERLSGPEPLTVHEAARRATRVTRFAARFLAETPEGQGHPGPTDDLLARRFQDCVKPPSALLYPRIRAEVVRVLLERAAEPTPGAPFVGIKYMPWSGPPVVTPVAVGNRLMKNALASDCGALVWVCEIAHATRGGRRGIWVRLRDGRGHVSWWPAEDVTRWHVKVD